MDEFYKEIKDNVDGRPQEDFRPEDWHRLEARMDEDSAAPKPFFWWHWLGAIAASILLIWNMYLHSQLNAQKSTEPVVEVVLDTLIEQRMVYITDTIYRDRVEYIRIPGKAVEKVVYVAIDSSFFAKEVRKKDSKFFSNLYGSRDLKSGSIDNSFSIDPQDVYRDRIFNMDATTEPLQQHTKILEDSMLPIGHAKGTTRLASTPYINSGQLSQKRFTSFSGFQPRAFSVEVGTGLMDAYQTDIQHLLSYSLSIGAHLRFEPGYRIWTDVGFHNMHFKASEMGDDIGVPVVIPPSDEFEFENARVPRRALEYTAGLDYVFGPENRLRPVLGIGIAAVHYLTTEIVYDFINDDTGVEFIFEKNSTDESPQFNYAVLKFGFEYSLNRRYHLAFNGYYRRGFDDVYGINDLMRGQVSIGARIF